MNPISKVAQALGRVANHPINRRRRLKAVLEYGVIQLAARFAPGEICVEFPNQTRILVPPRMKGAAHYIAPRLCELEEMSFVMHFLRPGDFFADVGANIGVFTILAAGVGGARTKSFEPSPDTFEALSRNIRLNGFQERSVAIQAIVGGKEGAAQLSVGLGTENCVATGAAASHSVTVPMTTLDRELAATPPDLLKVDVEGFETEVFAGAHNTLRNPRLQAIIIEKNGLGSRYGFDEEALHREIRGCGFVACHYDPFARQLSDIAGGAEANLIYSRNLAAANSRLKAAPPFTLGDLSL
jgi:FkbM family methyltransferase